MPRDYMNDVLKEMPAQYRQGEENSREELGAYRRRMTEMLNEEPHAPLLDAHLPEKLLKYKTEPEEQEARRQRSRRMMTKKVNAYTAMVGLTGLAKPFGLRAADSALRYYLTSSGQTDLAETYEKTMAFSQETLEEAERRYRVGGASREDAAEKALDEQTARRHARGTLLTRLLEPLNRTSPERLSDLTDEETERQYAMYHAMLELVKVLEEVLEEDASDSEILFTDEERQICNRALSFLHPLQRIECQSNLICNPYYPYLDTKALCRSQDVIGGSREMAGAFAEAPDEFLKILGADLDMAVIETKREATDILKEELLKQGFDPDQAVYTRMAGDQEERFEPDSQDGIHYIYGGGQVIVTQGRRQVEMNVVMDRSNTGIERENQVHCEFTRKNAILEIERTVIQLGLRGEHIRYNRPEGEELDLKNPEHVEYLYNGGKVVVTADNAQVVLSVNKDENFRVSRSFTPEHARIKTREWLKTLNMNPETVDYTREDGTRFDLSDPDDLKEFCAGTPIIVGDDNKEVRLTYNAARHNIESEYTERHKENEIMEEAADVNETKWAAQGLYQQLRESYQDKLDTVSDLVKDADPALLKSSEEYKNMRRSLKELKELLKTNELREPGSEQAAETMRKLKLKTTEVYNAAHVYLNYKGAGTTDYARRRVAAAKAVREFADQQLKDLNKLAYMDTVIKNAKGKDSLETLLNHRNRSDEDRFREAGRAFALGNGSIFAKERISKKIWMKLSRDLNENLYHKLELDLPGSRKTPLSKAAQEEAKELLGYMVMESVYRDDLQTCRAGQGEKSPLTLLSEDEDIRPQTTMELVTETPAFQQKLGNLTRGDLYRLVTEPDHRSLKELAEKVRGQVTKEAADKVVKDAQKQEEEMRKAGIKPKAVIVR